MDLVDLCKIIGILVLIVMCWFFVFTVFKTNKKFLMSFTDTNMFNTVEGFSGDNLTQLENTVQMLTDYNKKKRKVSFSFSQDYLVFFLVFSTELID